LGGGLLNWFELSEVSDPRVNISTFSWRAQMVLRITVACTAVPVVEEIFWRGFLLRALINWDRFETIPLGTFTWFSFLATSLLSVLEHPDNWAVSILCWFVYNALMYWKKSILFLIITHGITNLALYIYVIVAQDWLFW
ncbi:MAG: CAAX prenyl protease-related protein, partial [Planctomycetota bacterium]